MLSQINLREVNYYEESLKLHEEHKGKIEIVSKIKVETRDDLSLAYSPDVAEPCKRIHENKENVYKYTAKGNLADALVTADVFIGVSAPGILKPEMVKAMNKDSIIFAMANPTPEITPDEAKAAGARIVGTGRSDFPNQIVDCK